MNEKAGLNKEGMSIEQIMEISRAFQGSRIFLTAFELGIFTVLDDEEKPSAAVAREIGADARGTDRFLNALCALGLLVKKDGRYRNSPAADRFLVKGKPDYLSGMMHTVHLWHSWSTLTDAVKNGGLVTQKPVEKRDDSWFEAFIAAMHARAATEAPALVGNLDLEGVKRVLDVGGGSGAFSMAFVRAGSGINATVFDLPNVVALTQTYIEQEGLSGKIDTVAGDYNRDELPKGYDLAFLSAIIHSNSPEQNQALFKKVYRCLNSGGRMVVSDFIMNDDRTDPPFGVFFALNMLVNTPLGDTYTESEIKTWITAAGMLFVDRKDLRGAGLIIGSKQ